MRSKLRKIRCLKLLFILVSVVSLSAIGLAIDIYSFSFTRDHIPSDAAIVLGAAVWNDKPSPVFEERIKHGINLYNTKQVKFLIFTGGVGENDELAESVIAQRYAIQNGVHPKDIFCETTSKITLENLQGAKVIIQQQGFDRILIVSDPLHMRRSLLMARDLGINAYSSPTPTTRYRGLQSQSEFLSREVFFYGLYFIERPFRSQLLTGRDIAL
ncbi:YdcF family protein [Leptolyngbya sp. GB1-A1]|uniref:YdcF family protein n=1 Tax=Leptolyngbya sp. GB1-A1 TaxID=2933908 RepID=UPI0032970457